MHTIRARHRTADRPARATADRRARATAERPSDAAGSASSGGRRPWGLLVLLCVPQFMVILDATVVNVALPSIGRSLGFATADLQWVVTVYVLMTGGLMLLGGRGADLLGRRGVF